MSGAQIQLRHGLCKILARPYPSETSSPEDWPIIHPDSGARRMEMDLADRDVRRVIGGSLFLARH